MTLQWPSCPGRACNQTREDTQGTTAFGVKGNEVFSLPVVSPVKAPIKTVQTPLALVDVFHFRPFLQSTVLQAALLNPCLPFTTSVSGLFS